MNTAAAGLRMANAGAATTGDKVPEPLYCLGKLRRYARGPGMNLGADMMRGQAHDAFAIGERQALTRVG